MQRGEIHLLALAQQDGFQVVRRSTSRGGQYNGPCPWCGGHDRFRIQPYYGNYGWFACARCDRRGSTVDYLMLRRGMSRGEALHAVGWQSAGHDAPHVSVPPAALTGRHQWNDPANQWQAAAWDFALACRDTLWSPAGQAALNYLRGRGLNDRTIRAAMLGYHAHVEYGPASVWGSKSPLKLWRGITIPWISRHQGQIWRLTVRDERANDKSERYRQVSGGSNGLYLADSLTLKRPVTVVTEGEFDALSLAQVCGHTSAVVATGTTSGARTPQCLSLLSRQKRVLIAFDAEEAGDEAARWWLARLPGARRLRPWGKDASAMLQAGLDLTAWLASATSDI